jgi:hypothetical protein
MEVKADIKSVTIYNSSAEINYQKNMTLPIGKSTIVFTDLTPDIVDNTINITASSPDVEIVTVTEKINYIKPQIEQNQKINTFQDSIDKFDKELGLLRCKKEVDNKEKDLLFNGESIGGVSKGVAVSEIEKASTFFSKRYLELSTELFTLTEKENDLLKRRIAYVDQIKEMSSFTSKSTSEIRVCVLNNSSGNVTFNFKFLTSKAGWSPMYDSKYQGAGKPLLFVFRANVFNATGTEWENINIKLSTANPTAGFETPSASGQKGVAASTNGVKYQQVMVSNTISEYDIKHKYSVPSDSKLYLVDVNSYSFDAEYYYLLVPSVDPFGFLMAKIPAWNKHNLIPGMTNIYNKGSYMGKTFLNTYAENDTMSLYLGKDNNVQAVRKETTQSSSNFIIGNYTTEKSAVNVTIKNLTGEAYAVQLIEGLPLFQEYEKVKFSVENVGEAVYNKPEGLLTWNFRLTGGQSQTFDYGFEIKYPKDEKGNFPNRKRRVRAMSCPTF